MCLWNLLNAKDSITMKILLHFVIVKYFYMNIFIIYKAGINIFKAVSI